MSFWLFVLFCSAVARNLYKTWIHHLQCSEKDQMRSCFNTNIIPAPPPSCWLQAKEPSPIALACHNNHISNIHSFTCCSSSADWSRPCDQVIGAHQVYTKILYWNRVYMNHRYTPQPYSHLLKMDWLIIYQCQSPSPKVFMNLLTALLSLSSSAQVRVVRVLPS